MRPWLTQLVTDDHLWQTATGPVTRLALPILGGISPLLLPIDDILPLEIRRVHIAEIFGSNFLFGIVTARLLVPRAPAVVPAVASAES